MAMIDVLITTYNRPTALAITLTSLVNQTFRDFRIIISDQTENDHPLNLPELQAILRVLKAHGHEIQTHRHLPRRGLAEHRQFLLDQSMAPYVLYLDDDLILESNIVDRLYKVIREENCGFVGSAFLGLSLLHDIRPAEQVIEFWDGLVQPEIVRPGTPEWFRYELHNASNLYHVQMQLGLTPKQQRKYKVAWIPGCILYDATKLRDIDGFNFWKQLPVEHCGEEVLVQLRLMAKYGGCGLIPSGVYHQELKTTIPNRSINAPEFLDLGF